MSDLRVGLGGQCEQGVLELGMQPRIWSVGDVALGDQLTKTQELASERERAMWVGHRHAGSIRTSVGGPSRGVGSRSSWISMSVVVNG